MPKRPKKDKKLSSHGELGKGQALSTVGALNAEEQPSSREDIFIRNLFLCDTVKEAGLRAGYTESYCEGPLCQKLKNPKVQEKIKKVFLETQSMNLPMIAKIYKNGLEHISKPGNILDFAKLSQIDKRILQLTGMLAQDSAPAPMISIGAVQNLMLQLGGDMTPRLPAQASGDVLDVDPEPMG
jgi:hypothetical protein